MVTEYILPAKILCHDKKLSLDASGGGGSGGGGGGVNTDTEWYIWVYLLPV